MISSLVSCMGCKMRKTIFPLLFLSLLLVASAGAVQTAQIGFAIKVLDASNNTFTGQKNITYSVYNVFTGGSPLLQINRTETITAGVLNPNITVTGLDTSQDLWVGIGDAGVEGVPRIPLVPAVDSLNNPFQYNNSVAYLKNGSALIGIGTSVPTAKVDILGGLNATNITTTLICLNGVCQSVLAANITNGTGILDVGGQLNVSVVYLNTLYLGIGAQASDSALFGGKNTTYFLNSTGGTYDNASWNQLVAAGLFLGINSVAANSNQLGGQVASYYANTTVTCFSNGTNCPAQSATILRASSPNGSVVVAQNSTDINLTVNVTYLITSALNQSFNDTPAIATLQTANVSHNTSIANLNLAVANLQTANTSLNASVLTNNGAIANLQTANTSLNASVLNLNNGLSQVNSTVNIQVLINATIDKESGLALQNGTIARTGVCGTNQYQNGSNTSGVMCGTLPPSYNGVNASTDLQNTTIARTGTCAAGLFANGTNTSGVMCGALPASSGITNGSDANLGTLNVTTKLNVGSVNFSTSIVPEGTNLYYTDTRASGAYTWRLGGSVVANNSQVVLGNGSGVIVTQSSLTVNYSVDTTVCRANGSNCPSGAQTIYNATSSFNFSGITNKTLSNTSIADGSTFDVIESSTAGVDLRVNFTGVTSFDYIDMREKYSGVVANTLTLSLWNYNTSAWDTVETFMLQSVYVTSSSFILQNPYLNVSNGSVVQARLTGPAVALSVNQLLVDYLVLRSNTGASGASLDGSGITNAIALWLDPDSLGSSIITQPSSNATAIAGNATVNGVFSATGGANVTGNIIATTFNGAGTGLTGTAASLTVGIATTANALAAGTYNYGSGAVQVNANGSNFLNGQSGSYYVNNTLSVCFANGTNCPTAAANGGWLNSSSLVILANNATNVSINNTDLFVDTRNDRVGIGTSTPTTALEVKGVINTSGPVVVNGAVIHDAPAMIFLQAYNWSNANTSNIWVANTSYNSYYVCIDIYKNNSGAASNFGMLFNQVTTSNAYKQNSVSFSTLANPATSAFNLTGAPTTGTNIAVGCFNVWRLSADNVNLMMAGSVTVSDQSVIWGGRLTTANGNLNNITFGAVNGAGNTNFTGYVEIYGMQTG